MLSSLPNVACKSLNPSSKYHDTVPNHLYQDRTIVGVAVPSISNQFNSFDDIAWYESAYLLTNCAFTLPMGKIYVRDCPFFGLHPD